LIDVAVAIDVSWDSLLYKIPKSLYTLLLLASHPPVGFTRLLSAGNGPDLAKTTVLFSCEM
jgi:hypothetical protein